MREDPYAVYLLKKEVDLSESDEKEEYSKIFQHIFLFYKYRKKETFSFLFPIPVASAWKVREKKDGSKFNL